MEGTNVTSCVPLKQKSIWKHQLIKCLKPNSKPRLFHFLFLS